MLSEIKHDSSIGGMCRFELECSKKQRQLAMAVRELSRSNEELEQVASIASHDLQEPLRTISSHLQLIRKKNEKGLDESSKESLQFAIDASERLQVLIRDMLTFARVGTKKDNFKQFESGSALNEALINLKDAINVSGAQITVGPLPVIVADPKRITQLFQNLVGNALKYRSENPPTIKIDSRRVGASWEFSIKDNGIGIDADSYKRIFEMFQRLHTQNEYPGTGIGLAICKKIVEQRGGSLWVNSEPGKGSVFSFTIPDELPI